MRKIRSGISSTANRNGFVRRCGDWRASIWPAPEVSYSIVGWVTASHSTVADAAGPVKAQAHLDAEEEEPVSSGTSSNRTEEENVMVVNIEDVEGVGSVDVAGSDHSTQKLVWSLTAILRSR